MISTIKTYLFGGIATIVLAFCVWGVIHERHVGAAKVEARDVVINTQRQKLADAATQHNKDVLALAQKQSDKIGDTFEETIAAPVVDPPHVLCYRPAPVGGGLPKATGDQPGHSGTPVESAEDSIDIGPPLDTVGRDDDAQINALIDQVQVLVDAMHGKTK